MVGEGLGLPESVGKRPEEAGAEAGKIVWEAVGKGSGHRERSRQSVMRHLAPFMSKSIILLSGGNGSLSPCYP